MECFLKNQHKYKNGEKMQGIKIFEHEFDIGSTPVYEVSEDGNVGKRNNKVHLEKNGKVLTRDYWSIIEISDDFYIVCDLNASGCFLDDLNEFYLEKEIAILKPTMKFKYGVIKLVRDEKGEVIPFNEKTIVPIMYDRITESNEDTLIAYSNGKMTYLDFDSESSNYGKQIIPAVLDTAVPFDVHYPGFAECSIDGVVGYIPRNCKPRHNLEASDLLTESQVEFLLDRDENWEAVTKEKLLDLTGLPKVLKYTNN